MCLYLDTPSGNISLQKLINYTLTRYKFARKIYETNADVNLISEILCNEDFARESGCLIVGSVKDKISHFMIR